MPRTEQEKSLRPGGPFPIQLLFRNKVPQPDQRQALAVLTEHIGAVEAAGRDAGAVSFLAKDHVAQFQDESAPVVLSFTSCVPFFGEMLDAFVRANMWDCPDRDVLLQECRWQVVAGDALAGGLPAMQRAELDMDWLLALLELFPSCGAVYFPSAGKLFRPEQICSAPFTGIQRFLHFGMNVRMFQMPDGDSVITDTLGLQVLNLPDLQYHYRGLPPGWVAAHAYTMASMLLQNGDDFEDGDTVDGMENGQLSDAVEWECRREVSILQPKRTVLDIAAGQYAAPRQQAQQTPQTGQP